jgi:hypothetical protein
MLENVELPSLLYEIKIPSGEEGTVVLISSGMQAVLINQK